MAPKRRNQRRTELLAPGELKREMAEKQRRERKPGRSRVQTGALCDSTTRVGNQNKGFSQHREKLEPKPKRRYYYLAASSPSDGQAQDSDKGAQDGPI